MLIRAARLARNSQIFPNKKLFAVVGVCRWCIFCQSNGAGLAGSPEEQGVRFPHRTRCPLLGNWPPDSLDPPNKIVTGERVQVQLEGVWSVNGVHGGDLASFSPGTVGDELRLTPHRAKKLIGAKEAFLAGQVGDGCSGR